MGVTDATLKTAEMSRIDGNEQDAILRYISMPRGNTAHEMLELNTCVGDLHVIVNTLNDYANMLERLPQEKELSDYVKELFLLHAARCRKIADKFSKQMGYDYSKALERCRKRRTKESSKDNTGMDGLEAVVQKQRHKIAK